MHTWAGLSLEGCGHNNAFPATTTSVLLVVKETIARALRAQKRLEVQITRYSTRCQASYTRSCEYSWAATKSNLLTEALKRQTDSKNQCTFVVEVQHALMGVANNFLMIRVRIQQRCVLA